jgi:HEAT repeat protein
MNQMTETIIEFWLSDDNPEVRLEGIRAAIIAGDSILPTIDRLSRHPNADVRQAAMYVAGQLGPDALYILERGIQDAEPSVRAQAVGVIGTFDAQSALPILNWAIEDEDWYVRLEAVFAAGQLGPDALHILERGIQDEDPDVRRAAVSSAALIGPAAHCIIERALHDADPIVHQEALRLIDNRR